MILPPLALRWTIGDVHPRGFAALRLSLWGAWRLFGPGVLYSVCVNTLDLAEARARTGAVPDAVTWRAVSRRDIPGFLNDWLDAGMAEGVAWKFAPLRLHPDRHEIALDNDCILWRVPGALRDWLLLGDGVTCLLAEDVRACFGQFAPFCGPQARNAGLRGLPPGFDFAAALRTMLAHHPVPLASELDEQGLQVAALSRLAPPRAVPLADLTVCSPFHPHLPDLGRCGAHFVGLNSRHIPWDYYDRPADLWIAEFWARHAPALHRAVGLPVPAEPLSAAAASGPASLPACR